MEKHHRDAIQKNYASLVQQCNIDILLPVLVQKQIFSKQMIGKYKTIVDNLKKKREIFLDIQMRGPRAFANLVAALDETGHNHLANCLDPTANNHIPIKKHANPFLLPTNIEDVNYDPQEIQALGQESVENNINLKTQPLKVDVKYSTQLYDQNTHVPTYSTHSKRRGAVLIINIINYENDIQPQRKGADVDSKNLNELFLQMGLTVELYADLTVREIMAVIRNFKLSSRIVGCDMVFVIVMGHGTINKDFDVSEVIGTDNDCISTKWIEEQFNNTQCKILQNKPKIFVYQMCRGELPDFGTMQYNIENDSGIIARSAAHMTLRSCSDMLIAHSTLPGNVSHRDVHLGTWYISLFCKAMMEHAHNTHVEDIFKLIDSKLALLRSGSKTMQTSMYTNIGFKTCYVHPGIYMDDDNIIKNIHDN